MLCLWKNEFGKCVRCKASSDCRDVLGDGSAVCFKCTTEKEKQAYGRRLFGFDIEEKTNEKSK